MSDMHRDLNWEDNELYWRGGRISAMRKERLRKTVEEMAFEIQAQKCSIDRLKRLYRIKSDC